MRGACLSYRGTGGRKVLDGLNMTIGRWGIGISPHCWLVSNYCRGEIYGLLGASGCGKTSLLSVLVGRRELDSGLVQVRHLDSCKCFLMSFFSGVRRQAKTWETHWVHASSMAYLIYSPCYSCISSRSWLSIQSSLSERPFFTLVESME